MPLYRLFSVFVICCALTIAGCSKSSTDAGLEKEDLDGDGIADIYDPDIDGDGIPNGSDPDIDGDGIPNDKDPDIDGDGKPNGKDPDSDGDGKPNEIDNTPIGDTWGPGTPGQCPGDASGTYPNCACPSGSQYNAQSNDCVADNPAGIGVEDPGIRYCDQIQVFGLNEEDSTGSIISISWQLQSSKTNGDCVLKDDVTPNLVAVNASAAGAKSTTSERTNPVINTRTRIRIPAACTGETVEVTYDFTEIADLIKADPNAPGWTVKQRHRGDAARCDIDGDGLPDFGLQCPAGATGDGWPDCDCPDGEEYDEEKNECCACEGDTEYNEAANKCCQLGITTECCLKEIPHSGSLENCVGNCRLSYLDCLWRCDTAYCSEQCGKRFIVCCEDTCEFCWDQESNCKALLQPNPES